MSNENPHETALREVHALLAGAAEAVAAGGAGNLGTAAARVDGAISLLQALSRSGGQEIQRLLVRAWMQRGQAFEALGSPNSLTEAVQSYGQAIALLRETPSDSELQLPRDLALAHMNRGNARQKRGGATELAAAVADYDEAIAALQQLPVDSVPALKNSLGAAWMNRGGACERQAEGAGLAEALRSFDQAIAILRTLPGDGPAAFRINLAAAWMNRGHTLLMLDPEHQASAAREAAIASFTLTRPLEAEVVAAADIGLRARNVLGRAITAFVTYPQAGTPETDALFAEGTDAVDEAMALARRWRFAGSPHLGRLLTDLFGFGARLYLVHQPHFLAEYVLETLDPERSSDALQNSAPMLEAAREIVGQAVQNLERPRMLSTDMPDLERQMQTLRDLRAAADRLEQLTARPPS